jgi:hypothetical protein
MFAAPRTSAEKTHSVLEDLVACHGGMAYWIVVEDGRVFCFDRVGTDIAADPGFAAGGLAALAETHIVSALATSATGFVTSPDGTRSTLLMPIRGRRGHSFGTVGLTLSRPPGDIDVTALRTSIDKDLSVTADFEVNGIGQLA